MENGNEGYLNLLVEYVMNKKGFINKKKRYENFLINLSRNNKVFNTHSSQSPAKKSENQSKVDYSQNLEAYLENTTINGSVESSPETQRNRVKQACHKLSKSRS